jgi:hypothetical protein
MLSNASRTLTYVCAFLYAVLGAFLFFLPEKLAPVFAWKVTPFMTMTIGAWCLGNAWLAWITARRWKWSLVFSALLYLWMFGVGELLVLFFFRDKLVFVHPIAWLYVIALIVNGITALAGVTDWFQLRPALDTVGITFSRTQSNLVAIFVVFVGFLGIYGSTQPIGALGTNGGIFPETMSLFTLRSFGVFYLTLALGVAPYLWIKSLKAILHHAIASYGLVVIITLAAFKYIRLFDFTFRPGGLLYFGAYFGVGIPLIFVFRKLGTGKIE